MMLMMLAAASCRDLYCRRYEACIVANDRTPACQCPTASVCDGLPDRTFCAFNGLTYTNRCMLRVDECAANRLIRILHPGQCHQGGFGRPSRFLPRVWSGAGFQLSQLGRRELCVTFGIGFDRLSELGRYGEQLIVNWLSELELSELEYVVDIALNIILIKCIIFVHSHSCM